MNHMLVINRNGAFYLIYVDEEDTIKAAFGQLFEDEATQFVVRGNSVMCWFENQPPKTGMLYPADGQTLYEL